MELKHHETIRVPNTYVHKCAERDSQADWDSMMTQIIQSAERVLDSKSFLQNSGTRTSVEKSEAHGMDTKISPNFVLPHSLIRFNF